MEQLSGQDASFVYFDTQNTPMHIGSVGIYDPSTAPGGFVRFKDILRHVESRLHKARSFRQKLVRVPFDLDHPYWIEDGDFDIEFHVRHIALPKPGDWRQLCIQVARLHARPLDLGKPLWEFNIVEGLDNIPGIPPGSFALVAKVHHAAIDGMSGVELSSAVHDTEARPVSDAPAEKWEAQRDPAAAELLFRTWVNSVRQPVRFAETLWRSVPGVARLGKELFGGDLSLANAKPAPKTIFNVPVSPHRVFDGAAFPLAGVRAIKSALDGATVNDAILTIIGGGLRKYLVARDALPVESMNCMAPISVRAEGEKEALGNLVSAMTVPLGTHIEDPMARLKFVHQQTLNSKALTNAVGARTLTDYSQLLPSALAGLGARLYTRLGVASIHSPVFNCVATNVPGPRVPLYFAGAKMVKMMGTGPVFDGMGLINCIYSYVDEIAISFTSDRAIMPDPHVYAAALRESYDELIAAISGAAPAAQAAKASAKPKAKVAPKVAAPPKPKAKAAPVKAVAKAATAKATAKAAPKAKPSAAPVKVTAKASPKPKSKPAKKKEKA
jgi:diacylglycerol O-acyltransferase / wax synthase